MTIQQHPFNDTYGLPSITNKTSKLILGTFPAYEVTNKGIVRLAFYYGSTNNKFWDLFQSATTFKTKLTVDNILTFLSDNNFGIIDIIRKCYRKDNKRSADEDLCIIELEDIINLLSNFNISTIYSTSKLVTDLLKQQIEALLNKEHPSDKKKKLTKAEIFIKIKSGDFEYEKLNLPKTFSILKENCLLKLCILHQTPENEEFQKE